MTTAPTSGAYRAVLAVVAASTFVAMASYTAPFGNAVALNAALEATPGAGTWVLASMSVGMAATLLAAGVVADRIGRGAVFRIGAIVFIVANLACALAPGAVPFVIARIVAGIGATGMIATGLGLVALATREPRHQATTATVWSIMMGAGIAAGPVLAGLLDLADTWRWLYALFAAGGVLVWSGARGAFWTLVPTEPAGRGTRFDWAGFVLLTSFLALLITAIVSARTSGTVVTGGLFAATLTLMAGFAASQ